jgi:Fe(3+) dicitrate transport protein
MEYTHSSYLQKQPGGLTFNQFKRNPEISSRNRNWFQVNWNILQLKFNGYVSKHWKSEIQFAQLIASRDALGSLERIDRPDTPSTNRNLLRDRYNNQMFEARFLRRFNAKLHHPRIILLGTRLYRGNTLRQQGYADTTDKAHFHFIHPTELENGSFRFPTINAALFAEYVHRLNRNIALIPGFRIEHINTASQGYYRLLTNDLAGNILLDTLIQESRHSVRNFTLFGLGTHYRINNNWDGYLNFSRNYRSINFNDMRVANPNFQVDPNLKDEAGFTADIGVRGEIKRQLYVDISGFYLFYNDRIGTLLQYDSSTFQIIRYRTNIGQSRNLGIEALVECDWSEIFFDSCQHHFSSFVNFSFVHARYRKTSFTNITKKVEYVPSVIFRTGINYTFKGYKAGITYAYTSLQFSDASNTIETPSATLGQIPAYHVVDLSMEVPIKKLRVSFGCNNLLNATYFTRRAEGYPGPGIIPSDPRNYYLSLTIEI